MTFIYHHQGEFAAILTALLWTITSISFESASKKIGSVAVNILRLVMALIFLSVFNLVRSGMVLPSDASMGNWVWLSLSGLVGFVFGDLFLFKSYTIIGSRFSMLIMTLVPPVASFFGFVILAEHLTMFHCLGITLTLSGIAMAVFSRSSPGEKLSLKLSSKGILYAFGGAVGQALGLVLSKYGMKDYDPFFATQIRIIAGILGYILLISAFARWKNVRDAISNKHGIIQTSIGAFFGPFLGVSFSLVAIKHTEAGVASTIMALVPVFLILPAVILFRQKVTIPEILGAFVSVAGVAFFFI